MSQATAVKQVEAVVLRPETPDAPGVVRINGCYYDATRGPMGFAFERLSSGSVYRVRVKEGGVVGCDCPAFRYGKGKACKHCGAAEVLLAAAATGDERG
jgi:hypothetical protein